MDKGDKRESGKRKRPSSFVFTIIVMVGFDLIGKLLRTKGIRN
jgi:hypothetical protein